MRAWTALIFGLFLGSLTLGTVSAHGAGLCYLLNSGRYTPVHKFKQKLPKEIPLTDPGKQISKPESYDLTGKFATIGRPGPMLDGAYLFLIVKTPQGVVTLSVPEVIVEHMIGQSGLSGPFIGSHYGLYQRALEMVAGAKEQVKVLASGELPVLGGRVVEVYGRSGAFPGGREHLDFALEALTRAGFPLDSRVQKVTFEERPEQPDRHVTTTDAVSGLTDLALYRLQVLSDPEMAHDLRVFSELIGILTRNRPDTPAWVGDLLFHYGSSSDPKLVDQIYDLAGPFVTATSFFRNREPAKVILNLFSNVHRVRSQNVEHPDFGSQPLAKSVEALIKIWLRNDLDVKSPFSPAEQAVLAEFLWNRVVFRPDDYMYEAIAQ